MKSRLALLATLASLVAPAPTAAAELAPPIGPFDSATVAAALAVADGSWSPNRCAGASHVKPISSQDALTMFNLANVAGFVVPREAASDPCGFWLVTDAFARMTTAGLCSVMTHEIGHLLGLEHVDDPTNVMHAGYVSDTAMCAAAFPRPIQNPVAVTPAQPPRIDADDTLAQPRYTSIAPTARLAAVHAISDRRLALSLTNSRAGRLVVTFYRHGRVLGCGDRACREQTPWELHGRLTRSTVRYDPIHRTTPTVRAPRGWAIATLQLTRVNARPGIMIALLPSQVRPATASSMCEFGFEKAC